ncbi:hypothetical protein SAY86_018640 [Trapa natans]|uniref:Uncharacterized protein n=1 Tax=Trapa natans TaxID=22666 RepID=A0AAN7LD28_TRANT|nr:hypothetical protein SAY86_018640 [Trapa natans]
MSGDAFSISPTSLPVFTQDQHHFSVNPNPNPASNPLAASSGNVPAAKKRRNQPATNLNFGTGNDTRVNSFAGIPHGFAGPRVQDISGIPQQSGSLLHPDIGFSEMAMMGSGGNNLLGSSSSPMENYGVIPNSGGLSLSVLPQIGMKEETGGGNTMVSTSVGLMGGRALYNTDSNNIVLHHHHHHSTNKMPEKPPPAAVPMSATALLQKAAQMGSTRSSGGGPMYGSSFGLMSSSLSSSSSRSSRSSEQQHMINAASLMKHSHGDHHQQQLRFGGSNSSMNLNLTRDFLGVGGDHGGAGGGGGGPHDPSNSLFFNEELARFASSFGSGLAGSFAGNPQ